MMKMVMITYSNDDDYSDLEIGSQLPLAVTPDQDTTLIDPDLILHTDYTDILFANTNTDNVRLVAGMYDLPVYGITIDVNEEVTDASFEFDSPRNILVLRVLVYQNYHCI